MTPPLPPYPYQQDVSRLLPPGRVSQKVAEQSLHETRQALESLRKKGADGKLPMLEAAFWDKDLASIQSLGASYRKFHSIIIIGIGGASLGGAAMVRLFQSWVLSSSSFPFVYFLDNLDPEIFWEVMSVINPQTTGVVVISKSGETPETLIQLMRCLEYWSEFLSPYEMSSHFLIATSPIKNSLQKIAKHYRFSTLDHPVDVGGRFSCLTAAGLLPLFLVGGEPRRVRRGAAQVINNTFDTPVSPPVEGVAGLWALYQEQHITSHVMLSYSQGFDGFNLWYRQLWAESLGKKGLGFLPITGLGPSDQHSQLQLYLDGPQDKCFTFLSQRQLARERLKPEMWKDFPELKFLAYASMEDLVSAEKNATAQVLAERGCPVRTLCVNKLNEVSLGGLFAHFMLETLLMGELLGVDPLTQPAVDGGKSLAKRFLMNPALGPSDPGKATSGGPGSGLST